MKTYFVLFIITLFLFINIIFSQEQISLNIQTPQEIYKNCSDAIVVVYSYDANNDLVTLASGVIVSPEGLVFTNYHVIRFADRVEIRHGLKVFTEVKFIAVNEENDAAILQFNGSISSFVKPSALGKPQIGENVFALGNPNMLERTLSAGILSGVREIDGETLIQFTASISPGSSGGALLNNYGELIGITNSSNEGNQNLNFAVPVWKYLKMLYSETRDTLQVNRINSLCKKYLTFDEEYENAIDTLISDILTGAKSVSSAYSELGRYAMRFQLYDSAISLYSAAIEQEPQDKDLYKKRAYCYFENDEKEKALIDYQKALDIDSADAQLYISRADLFKITGRFKDAIDDYTAALRFDPDNYFLYSERADCFIRSEDTLAALKDLQKSVFGESKDVFKYIRRAGIYEDLGLYTEAIQDYDQVIKIDNSPGFYLSRAILYSKCGNRNSALSDYLVYLAQEPNNASALNNAAYCYLYNDDFELAEKYFIKALKNDHNHFDAYLGLSLLYFRQKKLRESLKAMSQAIDSKGILEEGANGLNYLKQNGYFWDKEDEDDLIKIFGIMGLDTEINNSKIRSFRVSARRPD